MSALDGKFIITNTLPGNRLKDNAEIARSQLAQVANAVKPITPFEWRVWNSGALLTTAGTDDLGLVSGTLGTNVFTVQAGDLKGLGATTRYALTHVALPDYYDDNQTVTVRLRAGMETTVADNSCTIDVQAYKVGDDGLSGSDLCNTAAQSMNSLTEANLDFEITASGLEAGNVLEIRIAIACNDAATGTAVTPVLYKSSVLFDARG